jgi:deoxyribodipyrimidine photo-lyase
MGAPASAPAERIREVAKVPDIRVRACNGAPQRRGGGFVLYWMTANRRARYNFALERAVELARELDKPVLVLEYLPCGRRWDCDRFHRFALDGMAENGRRLDEAGALYYPYVETTPGAGLDLVVKLARRACLVVTDEMPVFTWPDVVSRVAGRLTVRLEQVDSNGLLPLRAAEKAFTTAHSFRRFLQRTLAEHLEDQPRPNPLARAALPRLPRLPQEIALRWPPASEELLKGEAEALEALPIDHSAAPTGLEGGTAAAERCLRRFVERTIEGYKENRNHPDADATSGLSPYLRFGHISAHEVFGRLMRREGWSPDDLGDDADGSREGWWGVAEDAEAFLDELITWREIGYNMCSQRADYDRYQSLPDWALETLTEHAPDPRPVTYSLKQLEAAETHDELWNAAQVQLLREGRVHNYMRMLWGKKILEWSPAPPEALAVMVELNNKYALDGRNPNSYSGIFWVLGRYDRAWGPERPIYGKVRYMSSENTARKLHTDEYVQKHAP